ncbi:hypothetical protein P3594_07945 [Vibrio parahaemolyticus]|uniref:hypothetical protein n=1 Tax=Vibrio TaxID=662 RepID=UPI001DBDC96B|nr:hypothetical protein [Vibrio mediterranei]EGQ8512300.1 hypothetical protein [Vibrio parahaemolyticus]MCG9660970.1 hypothetical protein [Vibrio mediterranei]MDF5080206.1 hypothetical protein [Vibrio parahaemolyticus]MDF5101009.1 hypothetical protein [Vibrio parahaemolyticus]MDF5259625.1 hypothetical protein [Vibrio parahaemolyticus]
MKLRDFLKKYSSGLHDWCISGTGSLRYEIPNKSDVFLEYAEKDLESKTELGNVNALTNAKRAIDCQIEQLIKLLGLKKAKQFPQKIEQIKSIGLFAPRILVKVNKVRNLLEHEFVNPERHQAEDAVDVATLFVKLSNTVLYHFSHDFQASEDCQNFSGQYYEMGINANGIHIVFEEEDIPYFQVDGYVKNTRPMSYKLTKDHPEYYPLMKMFVTHIITDNHPMDLFEDMVNEVLAENANTETQ